MVLNKYNGSTMMDGTEKSLFKVVGTTMKTFASYIYAKALQAGDTLRLRVYQRVDDVSRWKFDGDATDSVGGNNGTVTNISSWVSQWKFDGDVNDSVGSNNGTITYNTNLKALYKFDGTINDSTSGAHNLTLAAGTTKYITGREGQAVSFDGSSYYTASSAVVITGQATASVSFWVLTPSTFNSGDYLFAWGAASSNNLFAGAIFDTGSQSRIDFPNFGVTDHVTATYLQPNTWYYLTFTMNNETRNVYINGVLDANFPTTDAANQNISSSSLYVGSIVGGTGIVHNGFAYDEFRVYNVTLSQAQVSALYMNGKFAQAHTFDGGEYITVADNASLRNTAFSVSFWTKITGTQVTFTDFPRKYGSGTTGDWFFDSGAGTTDNIRFGIATSNGEHSTSTTTLTENVWHHIVGTYDGTNNANGINLYVDGVLVQSATASGTWTPATNTNTLLFGGTNPLTGQMDEIRYYSSALTASQVLGLYNYTGSNYITPLPVGNAISLDGSSYVTVTNQTPYNFERTNPFSISAWFKTTTSSANQVIVGKLSALFASVAGYSIFQYTGDNKLYFAIYDNASNTFQINTSSTYNDGNWHNVIATYDGSANRSGMKLYIDGTLITTGTSSAISNTIKNSVNLSIGAESDGDSKLSGLIDEVQIFNYVISSAEINAINAGRFANTHPIGLWHFDGDLYDYSGQGSTGSPTGTMTYVTGALSGSYNVPNTHFNFDGSEKIVVTNPSNIQFDINTSFSVSFWLRSTNTNATFDGYVTKDQDGGNNGWYICKNNNNTLLFLIRANATDNGLISASNVTDGLWHHIVCTYNGTLNRNGMNIYIDGALSQTGAAQAISGTAINTNDIVIGGFYNTNADTGIGEMDDVRIYNRALSSAEVSDLYSNPDQGMKELLYDRTVSGVLSTQIYIPTLQGTQYMVTAQQTAGTNRIIAWEREEYQ